MAAPLARLVLRADGNSLIGLGHIMRLLALADILRDAFTTCVFASRDATALAPLLAEVGLLIVTIPAGLSPATETTWLRNNLLQTSDVLVLDGYTFDQAYQSALRGAVGRLGYIDDLRTWPVEADVLINISPGITAGMYQVRHPGTTLLLGPAYTLMRAPLRAAARLPHLPHPIRKVLVCFGGADPLQLTARCLPLLLAQPELTEIGLLPGPANLGLPALRQLAAAQGAGRVLLHGPASAEKMVTLLHHYDCFVGPSSTILMEALVLGVPALTGYYADNQRHLAEFVAAHNQAYSVGDFTVLTDAQLQARLTAGLRWLAHSPRQPYAECLRPDLLRAALAAPLPNQPR